MGELIAGLGRTVVETRRLLVHALHRADTSDGLRDSVRLLLAQDRQAAGVPTSSLRVFIFGSPTLIVAGERKQFSQRGRVRRMPEFLAYLLLMGHDGGCRWSEVSDAIWPDLDAEKASINFHQTIKRLRDSIFGTYDYIVVQDDYYQVNPHYLEWCDALAFESLYARASRLPPEEAGTLLIELIALYQGEFLAGFEVGAWGLAHRASCERRFLQSVTLAGEQLLKQGAAREALSAVNKGLAQDPFREELHHIAMRAYAQLGLHDQVAAHYAELQEMFKRELGAPPGPATRQLYQQLMTGGRSR
jgi:DNA-binding SARP family transcriptional activator